MGGFKGNKKGCKMFNVKKKSYYVLYFQNVIGEVNVIVM